MNQVIKLKYGYNTLCIEASRIQILTVKVRVKNNFPFNRLNEEFRIIDCKISNNKVITYAGIDSENVRFLLKNFTDLMLNYKINEVRNTHKEHLLPTWDGNEPF